MNSILHISGILLLQLLFQLKVVGQVNPDSFVLHYEGSNYTIDPNYQYRMMDFVAYLDSVKSVDVHIRGHVCCGPDKKLSRKRAKYVYKFLIDQGIDKKRLSYKGYSNEFPLIFPEKTEFDAFQNRRVDFQIRKTP